MSVTIPPSMEAKERGIKVRAGLRLARWAVWISIGISSANAATLFMRLESVAEIVAMIPIWALKLLEESTTC